jgi:hypothetical protein
MDIVKRQAEVALGIAQGWSLEVGIENAHDPFGTADVDD